MPFYTNISFYAILFCSEYVYILPRAFHFFLPRLQFPPIILSMDKAYDSQKHEDVIFKKWKDSGAFQATDPKKSKTGKSFTIPLPPPNVTGQLHLGHAIMLVIEDIMCRYHRMKGDAVLWVPGTDHASIATETVVLKNLEIKNRDEEISREKFLKECVKWTNSTHETIVNQIKRMGASCDWTRERYTIDIGMSNAVNTIFHDLYTAGLIYQGERMINWSVGAQSVLADDELEWEEREEIFYHIKCGEFVIGTVRPETKCADSPVVVNPKDKRYKTLIGQEFETETYAGKRKFFVLADDHIDPEFGSGAMTISTAHDANDFEMAKRHKLPFPRKIDFDGRMTDLAGPCAGMTVLEARKKSVAIMKEKGLILKEEPYVHRVPLCYRTGTVVEPMISKQWFVDVNKEFQHPILKKKTTLKKLTADAVRKGDVKIIPERFEKQYFHWVDNLHDWCISRQIWWGHRIPVWYEESKESGEGSMERIHLAHKQRLLFARHSESEANVQKMVTAQNDVPLTQKGRKESEQLAQKLKKEKSIQRIISSPLSRAKETADIIGSTLGIQVEVWDETSAIDAGEVAGTPIDFTHSVLERMQKQKTGESMKDLEVRAKEFWKKISDLDPADGDILIVGHGVMTALIFAVRDGVQPKHFPHFWKERWNADSAEAWKMGNGEVQETTFLIPPKGKDLRQDEDTLDTWFSSALWPFSTLGWPDTQSPDFQDFFPTSILETGHDIITLWVSRMIMTSLFATGKAPFHTVYLHGMVCDEKGKKMSKSKGNGIDPLQMIDRFGTDALRMSMVVGSTPGNPINLGEKKVESYRNFANKLWNVARFILNQKIPPSPPLQKGGIKPKTLTERWILSKTQRLIQETTEALDSHLYGEAGQKLYEFTWNELADWALEASKADNSKNTAEILRYVLQTLLKLLHPYVPFVTEKIWEEIPLPPTSHFGGQANPPLQKGEEKSQRLLAMSEWPRSEKKFEDLKSEKEFEFLKEIIIKIRSLKNEKKIEAKTKIAVHFTGRNIEILKENEKILNFMGGLKEIHYTEPEQESISDFIQGTNVLLLFERDIEAEKKRLQKEIAEAEKLFANLESRLQNKKYVSGAPKHLVEETRNQNREISTKIRELKKQHAQL